ncbi:OmpA family protein [uncultured Eudoraea sp.]|uniref:OmpA family protein n=1 Tax=uncultured Eudoraea sp. TaxID=1035614 RepID=UPI002633EA39|nr:OmpA family protein [uncultured Eudoraea sp.]
MKEHPEINFSVEGHTDSDGDTQFNINLSEQRANTVMNELIAQVIDAKRMVSKGFGEDVPDAVVLLVVFCSSAVCSGVIGVLYAEQLGRALRR